MNYYVNKFIEYFMFIASILIISYFIGSGIILPFLFYSLGVCK